MFYRFCRGFLTVFLLLYCGWKVKGRENIPQEGPLIVCSNHISLLDPPLVGCIINDRQIFFMAKAELFRVFLLGFIIKNLGAFPVKRDTADRKAIKHALKLLEEQKTLGLFPEGTRSKTGEVQTLLNGVALIALKSKAPVLPVAIKGPYRWRRPVKIIIGKPLDLAEISMNKGKRLEDMSLRLREEIEHLLK